MDTCSLSSGFRIATFLAAESLSSVGLLELVVGWFKSARAQSNTQPSWLQNRLFPVDETGDGVPLGPAVVPLALLTLTLAAWGLQAANAWRLIRWQAVAQSSGQQSPAIFGQFKGTSQRLTALTVATTLCTLALVFQSIDRSPHQPQQNIQLFISAAALLTGCLLVGMQGAAAAGALCTSYSFSQKQKQSVAARGRGGYSQLQRSMIHNLRNGPLTASTYYDPAKHKSHRVIIASSTQPADKSGVGSVPIPESPFAVSTKNDKVKSLQRAKAPTAEMVAEIAFERHASQSQVNRGEEGGGRPRHMHDTSASGTSMEALASEAAAPPQTPAPAISSKPRHPDLHARLSAAYAPGGRSALTSYAEERGEEGSRSDAAAADLLYSMRDPSEHRRMLEGMSEQEEEPHRNPLLFFANEDQD